MSDQITQIDLTKGACIILIDLKDIHMVVVQMDTHYRLAHLTLVSHGQTLFVIFTQTSTGGVCCGWVWVGGYTNAGMNNARRQGETLFQFVKLSDHLQSHHFLTGCSTTTAKCADWVRRTTAVTGLTLPDDLHGSRKLSWQGHRCIA